MRYFLSSHIPPFDRVLLIESGSRELFDNLLPGLYELYGPGMRLDLVTCYDGLPKGFREDRGQVFRVTDYPGKQKRRELYRLLKERRHSVVGMICSGEPIMTKWKWVLALQSRGKLYILNENGDYFWFQRSEWKTIRHFILFRAGLAGAGAVNALTRLLLFPLTVLWLMLFAGWVHFRRKVRTYASHTGS